MWDMFISWDRNSLSPEDKMRFSTVPNGESSMTGRTTFKVVCNVCGKCLHPCTNWPSYCIDKHKKEGCKDEK